MTGIGIALEFFITLTNGFSVFYGRVDCHQPHSNMGSCMDPELYAEWYGHQPLLRLPACSDFSYQAAE